MLIGIDLGTTNSLVSYWENGKVHLIPNAEGDLLTPSVVSYMQGEKDGFLTGKAAKDRYMEGDTATVASFKSFMGTPKEFILGNVSCKAFELSAMILKKLKLDTQNYLGEEIDEAVITVPAYFNDRQRSDTKKAAQAAGLLVKRLINEPSAAALAYRYQYGEDDKSLLVFDFGGGTLDISLVECFEDVVEIIAVAGDNHLGGDDIDAAIVHYFCDQTGLVWENIDKRLRGILQSKAEKTKILLCQDKKAEMCLETEGKKYSVQLTEDILFEICMPLFAKIKNLFLRILKDSGYRISGIDDLVMVGGSSRLSVVKRFLTEILGKEPIVLGDTDKVVAVGAGIYAGIRQRKEDIRDLVLTDVCPFTLGVGSSHGNNDEKPYLLPMIERNSTLPASCHKILWTVSDYQTDVLLKIYQGEEYFAEDNLFLGELQMPVPPKPAGEAKIDVKFTYDLNGILQVEVCNEDGERRRIYLANQELSEEELKMCTAQLEKMLQDTGDAERINALQVRLQELYEQTTDRKRERVEGLMAWFLHGIQSGRQTILKKVLRETERQLEIWDQAEENMEDILFDGELKYGDDEDIY